MTSPTSRQARRRAPVWLVPAVVLLVAAVLVLLLTQQDDGDPGAAPADDGAPSAAHEDGPADRVVGPEGEAAPDDEPAENPYGVERREDGDPLAHGPVDAPVVMVVYSDFQCPFCALWSHDTAPVMLERAEAGDLRIEWRDVDVFGEDSARAARAAYAAGLQDRYLDYHQALFEGGEKPSAQTLTDEGLVGVAEDLGLDVERFSADVASDQVRAAVERNAEEARRLGAFSTPSFLIGSEPVVGAQPTEVFADAVDAALERAGA